MFSPDVTQGVSHQAVGGNWVIGALLAELSAVLTTLGYVFTRRAFTSKGRKQQAGHESTGAIRESTGSVTSCFKRAGPKHWLRWVSDFGRDFSRWARGRHAVRTSAWAAEREGRTYSQANIEAHEDDEEAKKAQERCMDEDKTDKTLTFKEAFLTSDLWWSFVFRGLGVILWWKAGCMAPVTTVAPLFLLVSLFSNMVCGPALLQEQYRSREVYLSIALLLMVSLGAYMESQIIKDSSAQHLIWLVNLQHLKSGEVLAITICICLLLFAFGYYGWTVLHHLSQRQRFFSDSVPFDFYSNAMRGYSSAIPALSGLLSGTTYFEGYLGLPVCKVLENQTIDLKQLSYLLFVAPIAVCSLLCSLEGAARWDCRYFVPFSSTVGYLVATFIRILLVKFQVGKLKTSPAELACCFAIHIVLVCIPFFGIDRRPAPIQLPHTLKLKEAVGSRVKDEYIQRKELKSHGTVDPMEFRSTPLLEDRQEEAQGGTMLQSFERIAMLKVSPPQRSDSWGGWAYESFCNVGLWVPAFVVILGLLPSLILFLLILSQQHPSTCPTLIPLYCAVITGTTNLRTAIFSSVARWRTRLCMQKGYMEVLKEEKEGIDAPPRAVRWGEAWNDMFKVQDLDEYLPYLLFETSHKKILM